MFHFKIIMNNIYFTPFEQAKIEFSQYIKEVFSANPSINLVSFIIRTNHVIMKGKKAEEKNWIEILSIDIMGKNIMKTLPYNMSYHSSFPLLSLFFSHSSLFKQINCKNNSTHFPNIKLLLKDIQSQEIFNYSSQLKLEQGDVPWGFRRESIAGDRDCFFGNEMNIKLQAEHLCRSLNQCNNKSLNHFIHKNKI